MTPLAAPSPADLPALRLVRTPGHARRLARVLVAMSVVAAVALFVTPWQQSARGSGRVVAFTPAERQQFVEAPVEGRVVRWWVREGTRVTPGDPLFEISDNDPAILDRLNEERAAVASRLEAARTRTEALSARQGNVAGSRAEAIAAAQARLRMALNRVEIAERALDAAVAAEKTAHLNYERQATLVRDGLASRRAFELAELDDTRTRAEVERARAALSAARDEVTAIERDRSKIGFDASASLEDVRASYASSLAEIANATAELARIDVRLARQSSQFVTAPRAGTVLRVVGGLGGEFVKSGEPLVVLVPDTDSRAVELWVDGNDVPLITEGRTVRVQFEGWPALQFSGWPDLATGTFGGEVAVVDAADDGSGRFRVLVTPRSGETWPPGSLLRQGVRANGWVLLDTVPIGYELWRIFNGFPPLVPADVKKLAKEAKS